MSRRASRTLASLALAASLAALSPAASAAPRALDEGLFAWLAGWAGAALAWVLPADAGLESGWEKEGMSPDPYGNPAPAPAPSNSQSGGSPESNGG